MAEIKPSEISLKNGKTLMVRSATKEDAEALLHHANELFLDGVGQVMEPGEFKISVEKEMEWIESIQKSANELLLLGFLDGKLVGNLDFHGGNRNRTKHTGYFGMGVQNKWRGMGIGKNILEQLIAWARAQKTIEKINLSVLSDNQVAIKLYTELGFREEGRKLKEFKTSTGYQDDVEMALFIL